jgi:4-amino-4-deoxy-L-arabinose transferase-like glycosyltransferase
VSRTPPESRAAASGAPRTLIVAVLVALACAATFAGLRQPWAPIPWLVVLGLGAWHFRSQRLGSAVQAEAPGKFPLAGLLLVLAVAAAARLYGLGGLPLGPYVDEILTLQHSLELLHRPFDLFGQTPLAREGWVETSHLYLYFDLLFLKMFGTGFFGMKMFSVLPGIAAAGAVFLTARLLFDPPVALGTGLLFATAHWPVRLSRYGWDASFMVMAFTIALGLLLLALRRGRPLAAYLAGVTAGLCLYSYLGSRIALVSLLIFFLLERAWERGRRRFGLEWAFLSGTAAAAYPLFLYYQSHAGIFWARTAELSALNSPGPLATLAGNVWSHALMLNLRGGLYARDNYPGLPMLDAVTGLLLVAGLGVLARIVDRTAARLIGCAFVVNFAGGIFSVSPEGAPYPYRTAAVMVPAFLIAGSGLAWTTRQVGTRLGERAFPRSTRGITAAIVLAAMVLNLWLYFGLEPQNFGAMRVMAYEPFLIGREIARDDLPVVLAGSHLLAPPGNDAFPGERHESANPPIDLPGPIALMAILHLGERYDDGRSLQENLARPRRLTLLDPGDAVGMPARGPAKIIFRSADREIEAWVRRDHPGAARRDLLDARGTPRFTVMTLPPG